MILFKEQIDDVCDIESASVTNIRETACKKLQEIYADSNVTDFFDTIGYMSNLGKKINQCLQPYEAEINGAKCNIDTTYDRICLLLRYQLYNYDKRSVETATLKINVCQDYVLFLCNAIHAVDFKMIDDIIDKHTTYYDGQAGKYQITSLLDADSYEYIFITEEDLYGICDAVKSITSKYVKYVIDEIGKKLSDIKMDEYRD